MTEKDCENNSKKMTAATLYIISTVNKITYHFFGIATVKTWLKLGTCHPKCSAYKIINTIMMETNICKCKFQIIDVKLLIAM